MTQHRLTLPFLSGGCDPVWNIFTCVRINNRKKRGGSPLRKMKFRVVLTEEMKKLKRKTISVVPMRTVGDIF